jgi:hypothetical protein
MKLSLRRQRGIGLIGVLFYLVIGGFFLTIAAKLGPHYIEYLTIRSVMQGLTEDPTLVEASKKTIADKIGSRLYIDDVRGLDMKAFKYKKTPDGYRVILDYNVQEHLFSNVDVVLTFTHEVALTKQ